MEITAVSPLEAALLIVDAATSRRSLAVHLCNAYTLSLVGDDQRLRGALDRADLNLPDGTPVGWLLRRQGVRGPVRGPALVRTVARLGAEHGLAHYLWGGAPGVAKAVAEAFREIDSRVTVVGCESPPYTDFDDAQLKDLARRVQEASADVLWIGIGTPRQDYVVATLTEHLSLPIVPVGAAFDFLSGRRAEAPTALHGSGLEWLYRFAREPRRLWRRYLLGNTRFVLAAVHHILRPNRHGQRSE